jgi:cytochrome c-type biogenesis protein
MSGSLLLALSAGMLGAVNPCGFALLPAYLSVLVAGNPAEPGRAVGRALRCTAALTVGYVLVFGTFGLVLTPVAGLLQPRLPWLTVVLGLGLAAVGCWLLAGRSLGAPGVRAPALTGSAWSMVLFGMAYAVASLGCAIGPFLALVVTSLRAGSIGSGTLLFLAYAAGMGLVVGVTAVAVALLRVSVVARLRRLLAAVPRVGGAVLLVSGLYVAYYGWYELRLARDLRQAGKDPLVEAAATVQHKISEMVGAAGAVPLLLLLIALLVIAWRVRTGRGRRARSVGTTPARRPPDPRHRSDGGRKRGDVGGLLGRHQDPEQRVDQDLAARDGQQDQDEEEAGGPRVQPETPGQAGADTAENPAVLRADQALAGHRVVHRVHWSLASHQWWGDYSRVAAGRRRPHREPP